jgi:hypothetical protein
MRGPRRLKISCKARVVVGGLVHSRLSDDHSPVHRPMGSHSTPATEASLPALALLSHSSRDTKRIMPVLRKSTGRALMGLWGVGILQHLDQRGLPLLFPEADMFLGLVDKRTEQQGSHLQQHTTH